MCQASVEAVTKRAIMGEGPHWDDKEQVLYYVDIHGKEVRRYNPKTREETAVKIEEGTVSFVVPVVGLKNQFVIGVGRIISLLTWDGVSEKPHRLDGIVVVDDEEGKRENRLNDGKADSSGRLWAGTMGQEHGPSDLTSNTASLFSLTKKKLINNVSGFTCSNGLAWTQDNKTMYCIDSFTYQVFVYDYDIEQGTMSNQRVAFDLKKNGVVGLPDGMTIDTNGNLWIACFDGFQVIQVDPACGKLLRAIAMPSPKITSVAFGGANLNELYVTSASADLSPEMLTKYPTAGCTYHVKCIHAKGHPMESYKYS